VIGIGAHIFLRLKDIQSSLYREGNGLLRCYHLDVLRLSVIIKDVLARPDGGTGETR
jgi:hypothetical protein